MTSSKTMWWPLKPPGAAAKKLPKPELPSPTPTPLVGAEIDEAKKKARKRPRGRGSTVLAGRLMSILNGQGGEMIF